MPLSRVKQVSVPQHPFSLMHRVYKYVLPEVRDQLAEWRLIAERIPDPELRKQATASIETKQFHCEGGGIYAAARLEYRHILIPLIVAFQTISDYLDNLCDRSTSLNADDFRLLHQAMLDAVDPGASPQNYYALRDEQDDGGYLTDLVKTCQSCIYLLPSYSTVMSDIQQLVSYYCDLQVYKHIDPTQREAALFSWWDQHKYKYPQLNWNEFAAATGSTLGVFMLFVAACDDQLNSETSRKIKESYFPYICGLHILLDYFIDQEEDLRGGDLNFCHYYESGAEIVERMEFMVIQARTSADSLPYSRFHRMVVEGLVALYLSDPKIKQQQQVRYITKRLLKKSPATRMFFWINSIWIRKKKEG